MPWWVGAADHPWSSLWIWQMMYSICMWLSDERVTVGLWMYACVCVRCCSLGLLGFFGTLFLLRLGRKKPQDIFIRVQNIQRNWSTNLFLWLQPPILKKHTLQTFHFNYCSWLKHTLQKNRIKKNLIHELGRACVSSTRQNKHLSTCLFNYASAFSWC